MNEQLHTFATSYFYAVPTAIALMALFLYFQKSKIKNVSKNTILSTGFILRNAIFVGVLTFALIYFGKPLPGLEESIIVKPADF